MPNVGQILAKHNKKILRDRPNVDGSEENVIYQCSVKNLENDANKNYVNLSKPTFKKRHAIHKNTFKDPDKDTTQSLVVTF